MELCSKCKRQTNREGEETKVPELCQGCYDARMMLVEVYGTTKPSSAQLRDPKLSIHMRELVTYKRSLGVA